MTLTKADLVLPLKEALDAYNNGEEPGFGLAIDRVAQAAAAKAAYAVLDELNRLSDLTPPGTAWATAVRLECEVRHQLEAAGLQRPRKSG